MERFLHFLCALLVVATTGCGTLSNQLDNAGGDRVYGGVKLDFGAISNAISSKGSGESFVDFIFVFDVPLSLVGDTLRLPYDLTRD